MHKLIEIIQALNSKQFEQVYFKDPVTPKLPGGSFSIHAAKAVRSVAEPASSGVWLMDGQGEWHGPLRQSQINAEYLINALHEKLCVPDAINVSHN